MFFLILIFLLISNNVYANKILKSAFDSGQNLNWQTPDIMGGKE